MKSLSQRVFEDMERQRGVEEQKPFIFLRDLSPAVPDRAVPIKKRRNIHGVPTAVYIDSGQLFEARTELVYEDGNRFLNFGSVRVPVYEVRADKHFKVLVDWQE